MNPLRTPEDYEHFAFTLQEQFRSIRFSTVCFVRRGESLAQIFGEIHFAEHYRIIVRERLIFEHLPGIIDDYGYEIWRGTEKLCWYDPQPHPEEASLKSTFPHHKHVPPNIRRNRIPANNMSFANPNLPEVIREVEQLLAGSHPTA